MIRKTLKRSLLGRNIFSRHEQMLCPVCTAILGGQRGRQQQEGQGLVEFALAIVFLALLLAGAIQLGYTFFVAAALSGAAQEGTTYASIDPTNYSEIDQRTRSALGWAVDPAAVAITITETETGQFCAGIRPADMRANGILVEVRYAVPIFTPFLGEVLGANSIQLNGTAENTILTPPCP